jgi:hypothetical protein
MASAIISLGVYLHNLTRFFLYINLAVGPVLYSLPSSPSFHFSLSPSFFFFIS